MIKFEHKGNFNKIWNFLRAPHLERIAQILSSYGREGVNALSLATPRETGQTAASWGYEVVVSKNYASLYFTNRNVTSSGVPIVVLLQYGHATGTGGYVQGRDFINPTIRPIFDNIADRAWREVAQL